MQFFDAFLRAQDIFSRATNNQAAHILLAVLNVLLTKKEIKKKT
jgi:hypothetical protein